MRFTGVLIEHLAAGKWRGLAEVPKGWRKRENGLKLFSSFMRKALKWKPEEGVTRQSYWMIDDPWLNSV